MKKAGLPVEQDYQFPDIAFGLPVPSSSRPEDDGVLTIGVGVMDYRGWSKEAMFGEAIYRLYIGKLASFISWLLEEGHNVRLLTGDERDWCAVRDIIAKVSGTIDEHAINRMTVGQGATLHELMHEMSSADIVIATRYHNIVCALKLARPTISLGYAQKNDELLAQFDQYYCQHIETFNVEILKKQTTEILASLDDVRMQLATRNIKVQQELCIQEKLLDEKVIGPLRTL
jgi:polysaccharide pyruvyl transferase WcaK-like protein